MSKQITLKIPDSLHHRLERLVTAFPLATRKPTRHAMAIEALARGVASLEREARRNKPDEDQ